MSKLVDERVVEMRFDNSNFEKNTRQSMSTIQKLKASLNFSGVSNSLNKSVNSVDMSPITVGLEKAGKSFSAWEVASITAISNVTNRIVDLGIEMVKSLSVDNITSGWQKFTEQTKNTGTIISQLSSTMSEAEASGITEEYMEKLMWFADATSYSLTDMTSAIGKFIAKGKDMDTSFNASVGIANWAASAGKNAQEAQSAFEALSKVSDHVLARQWYSIQAANMDTIEFKNAALEAAASLGTLEKSAERFDGTIEYITKKGNIVTAENFADNFADEWFTMDALLKVLGNYGSSVEKVMKLQNEMGLSTPYDALDEFTNSAKAAKEEAEALGNAEGIAAAEADLFSAKAFKAASEARTLEDALNAVKDAVSTGWLNIFQKIIGTYENATEVFSELADRLVDIFLAPVDKINSSIDGWKLAGGRDDLFGMDTDNLGAVWNIIKALQTFLNLTKEAFSEVFEFKKSLKDITKSFQEFTKKLILTGDNATNVKNVFKGIFATFKLGIKIFEGLKAALDPVIKAITGDAGGIVKILGDISEKFANWVNNTQIFLKIGKKVGEALSFVIKELKELKIIDRVYNIFKSFVKELQQGIELKEIWKALKDTFNSLFNLLLEGTSKILSFTSKYVVPALADLVKYLGQIVVILAKGLIKAITWLIDRVKDLFEFLRGNETVQSLWKKFINFLKSIPDKLKKLGPFFDNLASHLGEFFKVIWNALASLGQGLIGLVNFEALGEFFAWIGESIAESFKKITGAVTGFASSNLGKVAEGAKKQLTPLEEFFKGFVDLLKGFIELIKAVVPLIGKVFSAIGSFFTWLANSINKTFNSNIEGGNGVNLWWVIGGGALLLLVKKLYDFFYLFKGITAGIADIAYALAFTIRAKGVKQWAAAIRDVALSLLIVVGAILILTMIDPEKLKQAAIVIVAIMVVLGTIILLMGKFMKTSYETVGEFVKIEKNMAGRFGTRGFGFAGVSAMILSFGLAILAIAASLKMIDDINKDAIIGDMFILLAIMGALLGAVAIFNKMANQAGASSVKPKKMVGVFSFALAMLLLLYPLKKIGEMPLPNVLKGILALTAIILAYGRTIKLMNGMKAKGMSKIAVLATAMVTMVAPISVLGDMEIGKLAKALGVMAIITFIYYKLVKISSGLSISSITKIIAIVAIMGTFIGGMFAFVGLVKALESSSWDSVLKTISLIATFLLSMMIIVVLVSKLDSGNKVLTKLGGISLIMAGLIGLMLSLALLTETVSRADPTALQTTIGMILISLLSVVGMVLLAANFKSKIEQTAESLALLGASFALFGAGVAMFAAGVKMLTSNIPALLIFMGMMVLMAVAIKVLGTATTTLFTIGAAFAVVGVATLAIGAAFYLVVLALKELLPILDQLAEKTDSLSTVVGSIVEGVLEGVITTIPKIVPKLLDALELLLKEVWNKITKFVDFILNLPMSTIEKVAKKVGEILFSIILIGLDLLINNIGTIVDKTITIILNAIKALTARLPEITDTIAEFILGFIDAVGETIEKKATEIRECMIRFCKHMWNAFLNFFGIHSPSKRTEDGGKNIILGIVQGIGKNLKLVIKELVNLGKYMIKEFNKLPKQFLKSGKDLLLNFLDGIKQVSSRVLDFIGSFISGVVDIVYNTFSKLTKIMTFGLVDLGESNLTTTFRQAGQQTMLAYQNGIESGEMDVNEAAKEITQQVVNGLAKTDIYKLIGEHIVTEIAYGISDNSTILALELKDMIENLYYEIADAYDELNESDILSEAINNILNLIDEELSDDLVLKPVIDTTDVEYGVGYIASLLSSVSGVTVATASVSAEKVSNEMAQTKATTSTTQVNTTTAQQVEGQNGEVYNVTFNVTGPDPKAIADECAKVFYQNIQRRNVNNGHY